MLKLSILMAVFLRLLICVYLFLTILGTFTAAEQGPSECLTFLIPNEVYKKDNSSAFCIHCFESVSKSLLQIWRSVSLNLEQVPHSYEVFTGENETVVRSKPGETSIWNLSSWLTGQKTTIEFPAFSQYCVGFSTKEHYELFLKVRVVNYWRVLQTLVGIVLFLSAPSLSRNPFFHYTSAIILGVLASVIILIFFACRLIPQKSASYVVLLFGYSLILYLLQVIWLQLNIILTNYLDIFLIYCLCAAFLSFIVCYRLGPVKNVRTFNIIQWCMQAIAVVSIYLSSEYREVSTALIIILITLRLIPSSWISRCKLLRYRFFPPKLKLLTELEYIEQGNVETKNALEELRKYCSSPDCNAWKVVGQLKDPTRFSKFIESGSHYTDEELLRYNSEDFDEDDDETELCSSYRSNGYVTTPLSHLNNT